MARTARTTTAGRAFAASGAALLALALLSGGAGKGWSDAPPLHTGAVGTGCEDPCPASRP
ncbi:hypothetical protein ACH9EU_01180 [Kocuria sp. M1R5S2]|uniref:hypothetical protein n=1 Tax=Kocuria rhizosphaerae TaxID=3376285 RepID=UPI003788CA7F